MKKRGEDVDASTLTLGTDFQNAHCLLNSEVLILLENQRAIKLESSAGISTQKLFSEYQFF